MDRAIASMLLEQELAQARQRGYGGLKLDVCQEVTKQIVGPDGKDYQASVLVVWDAQENGPLRAIVSIGDSGWRAFAPLTGDDLISPE
ncbi:MAG: hypothetical protein ACJ8FV_12955 [Xanthobacteraceae bacterium]